MMTKFLVVVFVVPIVFYSTQLRGEVLDMMTNSFDDQYIGCEAKMEREMPQILAKERKYKEFDEMWKKAELAWKTTKSKVPSAFKDVHGVAVVLYTMKEPHPIYKQLNNNVSIAGQSRDYYMTRFHFKALHFYLTRALQLLRTGCRQRSTTYRGDNWSWAASSELRFGRFASSSKNEAIARGFGTSTFFTISTCFGVDIDDLSETVSKEQEVLIPVAEKFNKTKTSGNHYSVESTGQLCSYFNCAYLGGEKRKIPVCHSGAALDLESRSRLFCAALAINILITLLF